MKQKKEVQKLLKFKISDKDGEYLGVVSAKNAADALVIAKKLNKDAEAADEIV